MENPEAGRIIELPATTLFTKTATGDAYSKLVHSIRNAYFRISVFTNEPADKNNGPISIPMNMATMHGYLDIVDKILKGPPDTKQKIDVYANKYENKQRTNERILLGSLYIGKNKEGINWISLISADPNRPKVIFEYNVNDYYNFFKPDGSPYSKAEMSNISLAASLSVLRSWYDKMAMEAENPPKKVNRQPGMTEFSTDTTTPPVFEDVNF